MTRAAYIFLTAFAMVGLFYPLTAGLAGQYDIKEMTPEVQAALDHRRNRFEKLRELKARGIVGENNQGYVEVLADEPDAQSIIEAENRDRQVVYTTVEKQNNLTNAMATIEKVFAQVQREKAQPGDKIQDENGQWLTK